jgi:hypothetical protein
MRRFLALATALMLSACSGGGSSPSASPLGALQPTVAPSTAPSSPANLVATSFVFGRLPATSSTTRRPNYVTANVASVTIALDLVNGSAPPAGPATSVTTNLLLAACPCTVAGPAVPAGTDEFTLTAYDAQNGGGHVISTASPTLTIVSTHANSNTITLNGVPASISITTPSGTAGTAFAATAFSVTVKDADGNTIMGGYAQPVTLSDSDTSGATTLATSGSDSPPAGELLSSSDAATLAYTGLAITSATITASAPGGTPNNIPFIPTRQPIFYSGPLNGSNPNIQFGITSGSFSASEVGWTNAPYNKNLTATAAGNCSTIGSVSPGSGTSFTATVAGSPTFGNCTVTLADGVGQTLAVTLTTLAIGIPTSLGSNSANGTATTSIVVTATQAVPAGSAIIGIADASTIFGPQATGAVCSDSAGNVYSVDVTNSQGVGDVTVICSAHAIANQFPLGGTITVSWSGTAPNGQLFLANAWFVTGLAGSPPDQTVSAAGTGSSASSGASATTAQANELLFGAILDTGSTVATSGFTPGTNGTASTCATTGSATYTGLSGIDGGGNPPSLLGMYCIVNSTGGYSANAALNGNPFWHTLLTTYKGATP